MVEANLIDYLRKFINNQIDDMADHMARSGCKDWAEYKYCSGIVYALSTIDRELLDLNKKFEDD